MILDEYFKNLEQAQMVYDAIGIIYCDIDFFMIKMAWSNNVFGLM
eukprot:CAMPEP_0116930242 /NCGR_PEP_ID=MMETSP0467-20121206/27080_1 /TAXON_ID=283647 /ORGANISM="Mesodinium pulex, Strain SPMC105" /LENGTH=44 /DNA_ID= /DNA_START= /DNA_END= /DNA_ORIENTATION=